MKQIKDSLPLFIVITVMYRWPTWARNLFFYKEGRVVYAFTNIDIGPVDFFTQEIQSLIIAMLIALLWRQWASFFELRRQELRKEADWSKATILDEAFDQTKLQRLSATFLEWQICSIFLGLAFIFYPILFWDYVVRLGDQRYTVLAIVVHTLWAISWLFISLPLFITWYAWHSVRVRAISSLAREPLPANVDRDTAFKALTELKPVGFVNFTVSGLVALFSFLLPILQALFR
jgi:hypothetical protein